MEVKPEQVQKLLVNLGHDIAVDGIWGNQSQGAMDAEITAYDKQHRENSFDGLDESTIPEKPGNNDGWGTIRHFRREEFRCKCRGIYCNGYPAEMDMGLIRIADGIREHFGAEAIVSSGLRCDRWNAIQSGVKTSRHRLGKAMDFCVKGVPGAKLDAYIGSIKGVNYHYHISDGYCHMDVL